MVIREVLISHFWDVFEEAMLRLKELGSFENHFEMGKRTDATQVT